MNFWPTDEVQNFQKNYFHCQHLTSSKKVFGLQSGGRGWDIAATLRTSHPRFFGHLLMLVLFSLPVLSISRMPNPGVYPVIEDYISQGIHLDCLIPCDRWSSPCRCSSSLGRTLPEVLFLYQRQNPFAHLVLCTFISNSDMTFPSLVCLLPHKSR